MANSIGIQDAAPGVQAWLQRVFAVMGGFIAGSGVLTILAAATAPHPPPRWTWGALASAGVLTVGTMAAVNFQLESDSNGFSCYPLFSG